MDKVLDAENAELTDLQLLRGYVELFQKDGAHFTWGNDSKYAALNKHPKAKEAFAIAFLAVFQETVPPTTLDFLFTVFEGARYWMDNAKTKYEPVDGEAR